MNVPIRVCFVRSASATVALTCPRKAAEVTSQQRSANVGRMSARNSTKNSKRLTSLAEVRFGADDFSM